MGSQFVEGGGMRISSALEMNRREFVAATAAAGAALGLQDSFAQNVREK
jgi:hypothetical protein